MPLLLQSILVPIPLGPSSRQVRYEEAIVVVNDLILRNEDSTLLLLEAPFYEKLTDHQASMNIYRIAHNYFKKMIEKGATRPEIIYGKIFTESKLFGKDSVRPEIDYYLKKYPKDRNLEALLNDILK